MINAYIRGMPDVWVMEQWEGGGGSGRGGRGQLFTQVARPVEGREVRNPQGQLSRHLGNPDSLTLKFES